MPLYEYQCQNCGRTLEKRQKFSDAELTECPHCAGKLEKLISAPAVQFKGGGWYADGYGSSKGGAKSGSGDNAGSSGASTSSDSAPSTGGTSSAPASSAPAAPASSTPASTSK